MAHGDSTMAHARLDRTKDKLAVREFAPLALPPQSDVVMLRGIDEPLGVAMLPLLAHC